MGNNLMSYRAEIGLFYISCQNHGRTCKVSFSIYFSLSSIFRVIERLGLSVARVMMFCYSNVHYILMAYTFLSLPLLVCGDIESNPGPSEHCLSIIHSNIRSIRNKLDLLKTIS